MDDVALDANAFTLNEKEETLTKKVLIAKKFILEQRVLIKVLENIGYDYEAIEKIDTIESKVLSGDYDIVFTDTSTLSDEFIRNNTQLSIITEKKSKDEIIELIQSQRG
jgi:hypothetical protein